MSAEPKSTSLWVYVALGCGGVIVLGFLAVAGINVPIAGFWLSGADQLAVPVLPSPTQVTLLVLTPPFPRNLSGDRVSELFSFEVEFEAPGIHAKG